MACKATEATAMELPMPEKPVLEKDKLDAAVHYVIARVERPSDLGAVKLHKVLWLTDLELMYARNRTLAGETFIKTPQGPWGTHVDKALNRLKKSHQVAEIEGSYYGYRQRQFSSLKLPTLNGLSAAEVDVINRMIDVVCFQHTARSISEATHNSVWEQTPDKGVMPASCVFETLETSPTQEEIAWGTKPLDPQTAASLAALGLT
jgi:hypothetical protein